MEQNVKNVGVRLLHLVEQQHAVGFAAHRLGQVAAFFVAHVARGRTNESRHRVFLHELAHVDADQMVFAVKQKARQRLAQLGLTHAGGAEEQEGAGGAVRVREARARTANRVGHRRNRLVLAHHAVVQAAFHQEQLFAVALHEFGNGNASGARHDFGNLFGTHLGPQQLRRNALPAFGASGLGVLCVFEALFQFGQFAVLQFGHLGQVASARQRLDLLAQSINLQTHLRASLGGCFFGLPNFIQIGNLFLQAGNLFVD